MIPMIMIKDKSLLIQRIQNSLSFTAVEKRYLIKAVEMAPETIEEDKEDARNKEQQRS
jgi:hypothetical protein